MLEITYLKKWDCAHSHENDYPNVHFGCQPSPVVSVIVAVVLLWVIQHVVIVPAWFFILQHSVSEMSEVSWGVRSFWTPHDLLINMGAKPYSIRLPWCVWNQTLFIVWVFKHVSFRHYLLCCVFFPPSFGYVGQWQIIKLSYFIFRGNSYSSYIGGIGSLVSHDL